MLGKVRGDISTFTNDPDDTLLAILSWIEDNTDMAALPDFGHTFDVGFITEEDLDTQHLLRFYDLTDFMFNPPWATSILRD